MNSVKLRGFLARDPETRQLPSGASVTNLRVETRETWTRDGAQQSRSEWHSVAVFQTRAIDALRGAVAGVEIEIEGMLSTRSWTSQAGEKRYSTEVVVRAPQHSAAIVSTDAPGGFDAPTPGSALADMIPF